MVIAKDRWADCEYRVGHRVLESDIHQCSRCKKLFCTMHFDSASGMCTTCAGTQDFGATVKEIDRTVTERRNADAAKFVVFLKHAWPPIGVGLVSLALYLVLAGLPSATDGSVIAAVSLVFGGLFLLSIFAVVGMVIWFVSRGGAF